MLPKRHVRTFLVHLALVQNRFPDTSVSAAGVLLVSCRVVWDASEINCGSILHLSGLDPLDWSFSIHKPRSGFLVCCQYDTSRSFGIPTAVKRVLWGSWGSGNKIAPSFGSWGALQSSGFHFVGIHSDLGNAYGATHWWHVSSCGEIGSQVHILLFSTWFPPTSNNLCISIML